MAVPGRQDEEFGAIYKELDELYVKAWSIGLGFNDIARITGSPRWDHIYLALLHAGEIRQGKRGPGQVPPEPLIECLKARKVSLRQWANAYGVDQNVLAGIMEITEENNGVAKEKNGRVAFLLARDFPEVFVPRSDNLIGPDVQDSPIPDTAAFLGEISVNADSDVGFIASSAVGISANGKCHTMAIYNLVGKASLFIRIKRLKEVISSAEYPQID